MYEISVITRNFRFHFFAYIQERKVNLIDCLRLQLEQIRWFVFKSIVELWLQRKHVARNMERKKRSSCRGSSVWSCCSRLNSVSYFNWSRRTSSSSSSSSLSSPWSSTLSSFGWTWKNLIRLRSSITNTLNINIITITMITILVTGDDPPTILLLKISLIPPMLHRIHRGSSWKNQTPSSQWRKWKREKKEKDSSTEN